MTYEELTNLPFRMVMHLNMNDEHTTTYQCADPRYDISVCYHVPYKDGEPKGRVLCHWRINGKVYKSEKTVKRAIQDL